MTKKINQNKSVETIVHDEAKRKNIPTAEFETILRKEGNQNKKIKYSRNCDLDPQIVWRGKDELDLNEFLVNAPPIYIQEKIHSKALIDDLLKNTSIRSEPDNSTIDLFSDFNGIPDEAEKTEFYHHDQNWTNRMILGDSLQVMTSLSEKEELKGKVQSIYFDPPYGIKFNSNFQWSTTNRNIKDGNAEHITREPEMVKAFRDTWKDGIHSYLTYIRDRLTVARDLLTESGSIFLQIGDENVHRLRSVMDEVFGDSNFISQINVVKTSGLSASNRLSSSADYILWYAKNSEKIKYRQLNIQKDINSKDGVNFRYIRDEAGIPRRLKSNEQAYPETAFRMASLTKPGPGSKYELSFQGKKFLPGHRWWGTPPEGMDRFIKSGRLALSGETISFFRAWNDYSVSSLNNVWTDTATGGFLEPKIYVVQTTQKIIQRCILMTSDPGDLILDPTCGSGTTAYVSEQWGRRWITIDTSRVALALARTRIMGARFPFYLLNDSVEGQEKLAKLNKTENNSHNTQEKISQGFVCQRIPRITPSSISNNSEIDVIWEKWKDKLDPVLTQLAKKLDISPNEWDIPRDLDSNWNAEIKDLHQEYWNLRISRQKEMDKSIESNVEDEYLWDMPFEDKSKVRVAGPFTVESLSPHRSLGVDENDNLIDSAKNNEELSHQKFTHMVLDNLRSAGVHQSQKNDRIIFNSILPWSGGGLVCAQGIYMEGNIEKKAGILIGPEFGTVQRSDLVEAANECSDVGFEVLIACAFNFDVHSTELTKLGNVPVLKARMNADLHMAEDLKNTGKGNLFVIFGEPDIIVIDEGDNKIKVKINGVDVFKPQTGEIVSDGADGIACWFIDTDYNGESFFVRHAYFLGANDPYSSLKKTLKSDIDKEAWSSLNSDTSRAFEKPKSDLIAVKVINHLGDEVMKVFKV